MKHYLSSGMGVNSVALHLLMLREGYDFEAVFVNHGGDWPETYAYLETFQKYLAAEGHRPITILYPDVNTVEKKRFSSIYDYYVFKKLIPIRASRQCTDRFKIKVVNKYIEPPCFMHVGIDNDESHRAVISSEKGIEKRYLLVENSIGRDGCKKIITSAGLPVPMKSGCYFCPFQKRSQYKELRRKHPDLFCNTEKMELLSAERRMSNNKKPLYLNDIPLKRYINEEQTALFEIDEYPPCQCGL